VDDGALARLEHENQLEWLRLTFGHVPDALIQTDGGVSIFATSIPHPFFNQIVTDEGATEGELTRAVKTIQRRGERFYVVLRHPQDEALRAVAAGLGLKDDDDVLPGMAVEPIRPAEAAPEELNIHVVRDAGALDDHIVALAGFGFSDALVRAFIGDELWLLPDTTTYVGYVGGEPVVAGLGVRTGRAMGIYSISTVEAARRRGYGAAMTERILADGAAAGCDVGVLQASSMGRPIYERLGFRLVQEYRIFIGAPTHGPAARSRDR
jgi:GNAT superfamily N-acetyltransferase